MITTVIKINSTNMKKIDLQFRVKVVASLSPSTWPPPERHQRLSALTAALASGKSLWRRSQFSCFLQAFSQRRSELAPTSGSPLRAPRERSASRLPKSLRARQPYPHRRPGTTLLRRPSSFHSHRPKTRRLRRPRLRTLQQLNPSSRTASRRLGPIAPAQKAPPSRTRSLLRAQPRTLLRQFRPPIPVRPRLTGWAAKRGHSKPRPTRPLLPQLPRRSRSSRTS